MIFYTLHHFTYREYNVTLIFKIEDTKKNAEGADPFY